MTGPAPETQSLMSDQVVAVTHTDSPVLATDAVEAQAERKRGDPERLRSGNRMSGIALQPRSVGSSGRSRISRIGRPTRVIPASS